MEGCISARYKSEGITPIFMHVDEDDGATLWEVLENS